VTSGPGSRGARTARRLLALLLAAAVVVLPTACRGANDDTPGGRSATPLPLPTSSSDATPTGGTSSGPGETAGGAVSLGAKWDWGRYAEFAPYLRTLSGGRTYYEVVWCDVEPQKGSPDWSSLDRIAERSRSLGITLMLKLRVGVCWATGGQAQYQRGSKGKTESAMPQDMSAYRSWVHAVVARYSPKGVNEYAVENEINSKSFWAGTPEQYRTLVEAASAEIRSANPRAEVVDAGLSSTTYGYGIADRLLRESHDAEAVAAYNRYYAKRFGTRGDKIAEVRDRASLQAALASEQGARNLAYLRLMSDLASRHVVDVRQVHFYESWTAVGDLFAYLRATTPKEVPIEAWEVGRFDRDSGTDGTESEEMVRTVSLVLAGGARVVVWLPLAFDPSGRNADEPRFGLLEPDGSVRPAGRLFQQLSAAAKGATTVAVAQGDLTGVALQRAGATTAVVWSMRPTTLQLGKGESAGPVDGSTTSTGRVTIDQHPVRLVLNGSVKDLLEAQ
jgi:hypothetical protein